MIRPLFFGILTATAALLLIRGTNFNQRRRVPVEEAAARLRQAWANNHTTA